MFRLVHTLRVKENTIDESHRQEFYQKNMYMIDCSYPIRSYKSRKIAIITLFYDRHVISFTFTRMTHIH